MDHIETDQYPSIEFIHSMRNVSRDTSKRKKQNNNKNMKKRQEKKHSNPHRDNLENKGSNIDVVIG
jgi:hypothetical protein